MTEDNELINERYALALEGIRQIKDEEEGILGSYFNVCSDFLTGLSRILERAVSGKIGEASVQELADENRRLYEDVAGENYEKSFANPDHIIEAFKAENIPEAEKSAQLLSFLYAELRGLIGYAYEGNKEIFTIFAELFVEVHTLFRHALLEGTFPKAESIRNVIASFEKDNCDIIIPDSVAHKVDCSYDFLTDIICNEDLSSERFLYLSGEYVTENEIRTARFLNTLSEQQIQSMADTFTEGYRIGFVKAGKPIDKKTSANIRYSLGFERVVRAAVHNFKKMGLDPVIYRAGSLSLTSSSSGRIGFYGAIPNRQYDYDHRDDQAIYVDGDFITRKLEVLTASYEERKSLANTHAGPAVMEVFGHEPFTPRVKAGAIAHTDRTRKLIVDYTAKASEIVNKYIIGEERSFTIIAYPIPEIGDDYEKIFADTVRLNTLPYDRYERIQQLMIDALDKCEQVRIKGKGDNRTDLTVALAPLSDPSKQTRFENCVADVNIPVGEVFTSPRLTGTNGILNVTRVFLNGLLYRDLSITFTDGMITDYSCGNYDEETDNKKFIKDNILHKRDTLPMGEFAVGTNTTAYRMGRQYNIEGLLPILIAEKTGPHFAVGDTCYSHEEDVKVYNPDGKEIIARENEVSAKRIDSPADAYFQCHTDITIPYDELMYIRGITDDGYVSIIEDGKFALPGTEELNGPLCGKED